jgi:hypothetical protein
MGCGVRIPGTVRKVNQTGALGSPAKRCAGNSVSFDYCAFRACRLVEDEPVRLAGPGRKPGGGASRGLRMLRPLPSPTCSYRAGEPVMESEPARAAGSVSKAGGRASAGIRVLRSPPRKMLSMATAHPVVGAALIRRYSSVRLRGGQRNPASIMQSPMAYGLGSPRFKRRDGVRISVGLLRGRLMAGHWPHTPGNAGSSPACATKARPAPLPDRTAKRGALSFRYPLMANERAVNPRLLVRVQVPEPSGPRSRGVTEAREITDLLERVRVLPGIRDDQ